jgi:uncharacterized protein YjgD (DUF1641 family)
MNDGDATVVTVRNTPHSSHLRTAEAESFLTASLDSMTPALVQRLVSTMSQMIELVDIVNTDEMKNLIATASEVAESLESSLRTLKEMEDGGAISGLAEMGVFIDAMKKSMTSSIALRSLSSVMSLAETGNQMLEAVSESVEEIKKDTRRLGTISLLKALKDPEIQQSLKFMLAFTKKVPCILENIE